MLKEYAMKILDRYIVREFLRILGIIILIFLSVYLIADFFERIDDIIENHSPLTLVVKYYFYKIPYMVFNVFPFAILFATLLTIRSFIIRNELIAITSNAISLYRVLTPLVLLSVLFSVLTFAANEVITPFTNQKVNDLGYEIRGKINPIYNPKRDSIQEIWVRGFKSQFFNMDLLIKSLNQINRITIYRLDDKFQLTERLDAEKLIYDNGKWVFINGIIRTFKGSDWENKVRFSEKQIYLQETFEDFQRVEKKPEAMPFAELKAYLERLRRSGLAPEQYKDYVVDLYSKLSIPVACTVMVLLGIPFALKTGRFKGNVIGIAMSIVLGFVYWIIFYLGISLGHGGKLPPIIAAFAPVIIFGGIGTYLFIRLEK